MRMLSAKSRAGRAVMRGLLVVRGCAGEEAEEGWERAGATREIALAERTGRAAAEWSAVAVGAVCWMVADEAACFAGLPAEPCFRTRVESGANSRNCQKGRGAPPAAEMKSISVTEPSRMRLESSCAESPCSTVPSERWRLKSGLVGSSDKGRRSLVGIVAMRGLLVGTRARA